jgi:hypothetical protein
LDDPTQSSGFSPVAASRAIGKISYFWDKMSIRFRGRKPAWGQLRRRSLV